MDVKPVRIQPRIESYLEISFQITEDNLHGYIELKGTGSVFSIGVSFKKGT